MPKLICKKPERGKGRPDSVSADEKQETEPRCGNDPRPRRWGLISFCGWQVTLLCLLSAVPASCGVDVRAEGRAWHMNVLETPAVLATPFADVAYYVPRDPQRVLVLASGYPWDDDTASPEQLRKYILQDVERWKTFGDRNHVLIVAPGFGTNHFAAYRELRGYPVNPDAFLNSLIDGPIAEHVPLTKGRFSLHGHSAGAQFSARYLVAHPERLEAVVLSAPSTYPVPRKNIPWPYGEGAETADLRAGDKYPAIALNVSNRPSPEGWLRAATSVAVTVMVGSQDREPRPQAPGNVGFNRMSRGVSWVKAMKDLAARNHCSSTIRFILIKGLSHNEVAMMIPAQSILEAQWRLGEPSTNCSKPWR